MKKGLIFSLIMVSVTSFAGTLKVKCDVSEDLKKLIAPARMFSGEITITTQADEVIFADAFLALNPDKDLLVLQEMYGTQRKVEAGKRAKNEVLAIELTSQDDAGTKVQLLMDLGADGINSGIMVGDQKISYTATCVAQ